MAPASVQVRRRQTWAALLLATGAAGVLFACDPARTPLFPPCPFHALTGLHCPGCGTMRALHQLLHGDVRAALGLNPLAVLAIPLLVYPLCSAVVYGLAGRRLPGVFVPAIWIWGLLGVIVLFGVLRNIPVEPFSALAP